MKLRNIFFIFVIITLLFSAQGAGFARADSEPLAPLVTSESGEAIPGHYIIVMKEGISTSESSIDTAARVESLGGEILFAYESVLPGFSAVLSPKALELIRKDPQVDYVVEDMVISVEEDSEYETEAIQYSPTWGLDRIDQRALPLSSSYTYNSDGSGVHVYIVDTGIRAGHVEFTDRIRAGFTAIKDGRGTFDCHGHGTHVAGTAAGKTHGVAKNAFIHPVRVLACNGYGSYSGIIAGLDWIARNHVKPAVVNMSLGGPASSLLDTAITKLVGKGVTVVVAAGNESTNACNYSPARVPAAITVGATTSSDYRASYSNYGSCLDIFAPGSSILSASNVSNTSTTTMSGTSMASPHVAGVAALYLQIHPSATPATVASTISASSTANVVINPGTSSPNKLLYSNMGTATFVPTLVSPAGNYFDRTPTYKWTHILGAKYRFELYKEGTLVYSSAVKGSQCGSTYCNFTPDYRLGLEKSYSWRVQANFTTYWAPYSAAKSFIVYSKGFVSNFDAVDRRWIPVKDRWTVVDPGYLKVNGQVGIISSTKEKNLFPDGYVYEVRMKRKVDTAYPNYLIFYGDPAMVTSNGWWDGYHFSITNWQTYELRKIVNHVEVYKDTNSTTAIKPYEWNTVTIWTDYPFIDIWINGTYIGYYTDTSIRLGYVGIGMLKNLSGDKQPLLVDKAKLSYSSIPPYALPLTDAGERMDSYELVMTEGTMETPLIEP